MVCSQIVFEKPAKLGGSRNMAISPQTLEI
jgi:hypothetical protein